MCHIFLGLCFLQHLSFRAGFPRTHSHSRGCAAEVLCVTQAVTSVTELLKLTFDSGWRLSQNCSQIYFFLFKYRCTERAEELAADNRATY